MPSGFDGRDVEWLAAAGDEGAITVTLPRPEPWNQGSEVDCCTAVAIATAMEMVDLRDGQSRRLSPLFLYYFSRSSPRSLGGVPLRTALRIASKRGLCRYELHPAPFTADGALMAPPPAAREDGPRQTLLALNPYDGMAGYYTVQSGDRVARWRATLQQGQPIVIGLWTQESYWRGEGMLESEAAAHKGAHAAVVAGYDDGTRSFRVVDSRGERFANGGEWDLGYTVAASERVIESWTVRTIGYDE